MTQYGVWKMGPLDRFLNWIGLRPSKKEVARRRAYCEGRLMLDGTEPEIEPIGLTDEDKVFIAASALDMALLGHEEEGLDLSHDPMAAESRALAAASDAEYITLLWDHPQLGPSPEVPEVPPETQSELKVTPDAIITSAARAIWLLLRQVLHQCHLCNLHGPELIAPKRPQDYLPSKPEKE